MQVSRRQHINASGREGARWGSIALGLLVAILAGAMISPILRVLFGLAAEPLGKRGDFMVAVVVFLVSGFLVYLLGGYVAARLAGYSGGFNGAMTAVFGMILGLILVAFGAAFALGLALPSIDFGPGVGIWLAGFVPFLAHSSEGTSTGSGASPPDRGPGVLGSTLASAANFPGPPDRRAEGVPTQARRRWQSVVQLRGEGLLSRRIY